MKDLFADFVTGEDNVTDLSAFNTAVKANAAGADLIIDQASDATLSTVPTNNDISTDNLHLNELG